MLNFSTGAQPPRTAEDFEVFCHDVYMEVFQAPTATKNGRSGQQQHGVDIFLRHKDELIGVQCKKKSFAKLTQKIVDEEVRLADAGPNKIHELIIATTAQNDAKMVTYVQKLSESRSKVGKFRVSVAFWDTLETYIRRYPSLQRDYAPHMPGGAYFEQAQTLGAHAALLESILATVSAKSQAPESAAQAIPDARTDSLDKLVDDQLDGIKDQLVAGRVDDALSALTVLGKSLSALDRYQQARWHAQRGHCYWQLDEYEHASQEFAKAHELSPDDEKLAGNAIRGRLLVEDFPGALRLAQDLRVKFPASANVFAAWAQAADQAGETPNWDAVPPELRTESEVLHIFAWLALLAGDYETAAERAKKALDSGGGSFEHRALRLLALVNQATRDGVLASCGVIAPEVKAALSEMTSLFEPVSELIWSRQSTPSLCQTVSCLGYAYMMTGNEPVAMAFLLDAVNRFPKNAQLLRICFESILRADSDEVAYQFGKRHLRDIEEQGKMMMAELAANRGDRVTFDEVRATLSPPEAPGALADDLQALEWHLLARLGKRDDVLRLVTKDAFDLLKREPARVVALNVACEHGLPWTGDAITDLVSSVSAAGSSRDLLAAGQLCLFAERYNDASKLLEQYLPHGYFTEPHRMLFSAYVRAGARKKALVMLRSFPPEALENDVVRQDAIRLARDAGDWAELSKLSELQLSSYPKRAEAWCFRASVFLGQKDLKSTRELLRNDIPISLSGEVRYQAQLAKLETEYGAKERGYKRLYRIFRSALNSHDAASVFLSLMLVTRAEEVFQSPAVVESASAVTLEAMSGTRRIVVVDPDEIGDVPAAVQFISRASPLFTSLEGKRVNDTIDVHDAFGGVTAYKIIDIQSAYRHLARLAQELARQSVVSTGPLMSIEMVKREDGQLDLTQIMAMLKAQSARVQEAFAAYAQGSATIGIIGRVLGSSAAVVSGDWPVELGTKLFVCNGTQEERAHAAALLRNWGGPLVVDMATVNELVAANAEEALRLIQPVFISSSAVLSLDEIIASEGGRNAKASMREVDGRIVMTEYDEAHHEKRAAYLARLRRCIEEYCEVVPAYGVDELPKDLVALQGLFDDESFDALLLALEKKAPLLTLDGRLREIGTAFAGISGVWPQVVMDEARQKRLISQECYSLYILSSVVKRRTHMLLSPVDCLCLLSQSSQFKSFAVPALLQYLAEPPANAIGSVDFAISVVEFLILNGATLGAASELISVLLPPIFARRDVNPEAMHAACVIRMSTLIRTFISPADQHPCDALKEAKRQRLWLNVVADAISDARKLAQEHTLKELTARPLKVKALRGTSKPTIIDFA